MNHKSQLLYRKQNKADPDKAVITGGDIAEHTGNAKFFTEMLISVNIMILCGLKRWESF